MNEPIDAAAIDVNLDRQVVAWDPAASKLFGWTEQQAVGRRLDDFLSDSGDLRQLINLGSARVLVLETTLRALDGTDLPVTLIATATLPATGTVRLVATKRVVPEEAVAAFRRLAAIVESSDDAIVSKDLNGIVWSWNRAAERMFGYTSEEMIGHSIRTIIPADRQAEEDATLATIRQGGKVDHFETIRQRKGGELIPISLTVSPIVNETGQIVGASKIARDITALKQTEAERIRLLEETAAVTETLNDVGAMVASDLDRDDVVQAVTDAATELTARRVRRILLQRGERAGESYTLYTISGVPREAFSKFPHAAQHRGVRADVQGDGRGSQPRHHQGSALRTQRAASTACRAGTCRCEAIWPCRSRAGPARSSADCSSATPKRTVSPSSMSASPSASRRGRRSRSRMRGCT